VKERALDRSTSVVKAGKVTSPFKLLLSSARSFAVKRRWAGALSFILGTGLLIADLVSAPTTYRHYAPTADYPNGVVGTMHMNGWRYSVLGVAIAMMALGLLAISYSNTFRGSTKERREARIKQLTEALADALQIVDTIQNEVTEGQRLLGSLENEIAANRNLAQLSSEQSKAVTELVRGEVQRERWPGVLVQIVVGVLLIGLGILISHVFHVG